MSKVAYYLFVIPLSRLPLSVLYVMTDFFYLLLITVAPYRRKVIEVNLTRSFPEKSEKEIKQLKRKFYRHFTDLLAEGVKNLSISENDLKRRVTVKNPEKIIELFNANKNVLLVSGHYNNWEWMITAQSFLFPHLAYGIGKPMTSKFWDAKINARRERFGMKVIHAHNYKEELKANTDKPKAVLVLSDQSPGNSSKSYWMKFLNQETAVLFGAELMAHELDYSVLNFIIRKTRRGRYEIELYDNCIEPRKTEWGVITENHTRFLENEIIQKPEYWLWSHKRWKRELPDDLEALKKKQHEKFNLRYKS